MNLVVDQYKKVTVSLAGRCSLACRHCYTTAKQFIVDPPTSIQAVVESLEGAAADFETICVSGDTDCFLDEQAGVELIARLASHFPHADIMFTTRLVPSPAVVERLLSVGDTMAQLGKLLLPGISLVSPEVPNFSERSRNVSSTISRIDFLLELSAGGLPTMLALRPTFPFSLVPKGDVRAMIEACSTGVAVVLGEVLILDEGGQLAQRLGMPGVREGDRVSPMTFLDQRTHWRKRTFPDEVVFAAETCAGLGLPYFLRSGMALDFIRTNWDWNARMMGRVDSLALTELFASPDP